jgi:branched-chain amino acid transport system ATP-binding protein
MQKETLLTLQNGVVQYGGVTALNKATVAIDEGEIVALMGPNGAGKSTALKAMFGLAPISLGKVLFHDKEINPIPYEMVRRGISYVPQGRQVFKSLTVYENLELGGFALPNRKKDLKNNIEEVLEFFPALREKLHVKSGLLSGGQQQMLAIGRGLVSDPRVLLLDEPSLGLSPKLVKEVFAKIREINELRKTAIMVVEHNIRSVLDIAHKAYVLGSGEVLYSGTPDDLLTGSVLQDAFLGKTRG